MEKPVIKKFKLDNKEGKRAVAGCARGHTGCQGVSQVGGHATCP